MPGAWLASAPLWPSLWIGRKPPRAPQLEETPETPPSSRAEGAGIKIARRNINNLRYADDTTLMAESEEELKSLLMKVKRRVKKLA